MQKMSCEQIYNIWISEPNIIRIVDLRDLKDYEHRHIPGAILASMETLSQVVWENRNRLLVFFGDPYASKRLLRICSGCDCVMMDNYLEWFGKNWPSAGIFKAVNAKEARSDSIVNLETLVHPVTGTMAWMIIDPIAKEVSCVNTHEGVESRWQELREKHYRLLFLLRTQGPAQSVDFRLAEDTRARICVPREHAVAEIDIPLEQGQEIQFGDRVIRIFGDQDHQGRDCLTLDFCGKFQVGGSHLLA